MNEIASQTKGQPQVNPLSASSVLQRKCACGNHTVAGGNCRECENKEHSLKRETSGIRQPGASKLQTKLAIGAVNDPLEQEADRVTDQVMAKRAHPGISNTPPRIQRFSGQSNDEQMEMVPPIVEQTLASSGRPLEPALRQDMEQRFGQDFSRVRIHTDDRAAYSAGTIDALAYTIGPHMVFGSGQYEPETNKGQRLLAHELTHVVQQGETAALHQDILRSERNDQYEQGTQRVATQLGRGTQVQVSSMISPHLIQRTKVCSKRLNAPVLGWFFNHAYIDDTGRDDCLGSGLVGNYAIQTLVSGNFRRGCAAKTSTSSDPGQYTPNVKRCDPKPGITDVSTCMAHTYNSYADPSVYANPRGPNSNTFAATLAKACCADGSPRGLGWVPGWPHAPALPCPQQTYLASDEAGSSDEMDSTKI